LPSARGPTTRSRDLITTDPRSVYREVNTEYPPYAAGTWADSETVGQKASRKGKQVTVSEGHPFVGVKNRQGDVGGEFYSQRQYVLADNRSIKLSKRLDNYPYYKTDLIYEGPLRPINIGSSSYSFPPASSSSNAVLDAWGAKAIARSKPTNSVADASTFLGELLKDGLPHLIGHALWKDRTKAAKAAGSEYLNTQFGWVPFVSDIRDFANAVSHAHTVLAQFERDSGRMVRRRYNFPTQKAVTTDTIAVGQVPYTGVSATWMFTPPYGDLVRTRETVQRRWFSGAFTYHLPSGYDSRNGMARFALEADKLLGISLTPETLWNLAPWSWAVDWFSSTGDVISNLSDWATYGLVMRYGYMMEHTIVKDTYTLSESGLIDRGLKASPVSFVNETKIRRKANPFGFGLTWAGLSPFQLSIAAALGLSRDR